MVKDHEDAPLPRGMDTEVLGFLTSVSPRWERGEGGPTTVNRLLMRLRIFWFFVMAIPILVGAFLAYAAVLAVTLAVLGGGAGSEAVAIGAGIAAFVVSAVVLVRLFNRWFERLTLGYRARLDARAEQAARMALNATVRTET